MDYRPLKPDEDVLAGDWWPSDHAGVSVAVNWFSRPGVGWCFRIDANQAKTINDWIWCGYTDNSGIYRDDFEDF